MFSSVLLSLSLSTLAVAGGVHRLKLQKIPPSSPEHVGSLAAVAQLGQKYGLQTPLSNPLVRNAEDDLYWTQVQEGGQGGHSVPLTSMLFPFNVVSVSLWGILTGG